MLYPFIHTADWHLRDTQYGRRFRGEDFWLAAQDVLRIAEEVKARFIINGGDTFQVSRPSGAMLDMLWKTDRQLKALGIPMYTVTGNHDAASPSYLTFPDYDRYPAEGGLPKPDALGDGGVEKVSGVVCIDFRTVQVPGTDIRIAGYPAISGEAFLKELKENPPQADFIVWHGAVREFCGFPMEKAITLADLPTGLCKGYLLGDIHVTSTERLSDGTMVSYPGAIELCEKGEAAEKTVDIYEISEGFHANPLLDPMRYPVKTRPVLFLQVMDDEQADEALDKVKAAVRINPDQQPLVFMRYHTDMKAAVARIRGALDMSKTVFRAGRIPSGGGSQAGAPGRMGALPELTEVVSEVLVSGTSGHGLAVQLCNPEANHRMLITDWVEDRIEAGAKAAKEAAE